MGDGIMREANLEQQFKQLELFFEEARQQREERKPVPPSVPSQARKKEVVELVKWPPHMRFD